METWLLPSVDDVEISPNNFTVFRAGHVQTHLCGGIALYIKFSLKPVRLQVDIDVDSNAPAVDLSNRTCPKSDGVNKIFFTIAEKNFSINPSPSPHASGLEPAVSVGPCVNQIP